MAIPIGGVGDPVDVDVNTPNPQKRFWNWQDEDSTFDLSRWHLGVLDAGLYRGFEAQAFGNSMNLKLIHSQSGAVRTNLDRTISQKFGVIITKQGVTIQQDSQITLKIALSTAPRIDLIIVEHEYKELNGGIDAIYKVIQGGTDGLAPALPNASIQVILGILNLPANCTALNQTGVSYVKAPMPTLGSNMNFVEKVNGTFLTNLSAEGNKIINLGNPTLGQDAATKYYVDLAIATNTPPATETNRGVIEIADAIEAVAGNDDVRAMTPYKTRVFVDSRKANQIETNDGVDDIKYVTPKTLENKFATETRKGIARIATQAEIDAGTDDSTIVTPFKLKQFLGLNQYVVDLGAWDTTTGPHTINHNFTWWDKIVASEVILISDDQGTRVNGIGGANAWIVIHSNDFTIDTNTGGSTDFNSTAVNRGYLVFWVKADIVPPSAVLSVNAGADQSSLSYNLGTQDMVLRKITVGNDLSISGFSPNVEWVNASMLRVQTTTNLMPDFAVIGRTFVVTGSSTAANNKVYLITNAVHSPIAPSSVGLWDITVAEIITPTSFAEQVNIYWNTSSNVTATAEIDYGLGNDFIDVGLMCDDGTGNHWQNTPNIQTGVAFSLNGYLMGWGGSKNFKLKYRRVGNPTYLYSNVISVVFQSGNIATSALVAPIIPLSFNLNGFIDSIGSVLVSSLWSVISQPIGSNVTIGNVSSPVTTFIASMFGTYVLRLTATNAAGTSSYDEITINLNQIANSLPVAQAKWTDDNTITPRAITTNTYDANGGSYLVNLQGAFSTDSDGVVAGYNWQWRKTTGDGLLFAWQDMYATTGPSLGDSSTPAAIIFAISTFGSSIFGSGHYEFRLRVKDNVGGVSAWSNTLVLDLTVSSVPTSLLDLTILTGGSGNFHTIAQLVVNSPASVARLVAKTVSYNSYAGSQTNDVYLKVQGGSTIQQYYGPQIGVERNITASMLAGGGYIQIWQDLNNTPPLKTIIISFIAYDVSNNVIGTAQLSAGHM